MSFPKNLVKYNRLRLKIVLLVKIPGMQTKEIKILVYVFENLAQLTSEDRDLILKAREAAKNAYAPYSGFYVGAAVLLENGEIIVGNNQENGAYPSGLCAERVALFYANASHPKVPVKIIAVTALDKNGKVHNSVSPCGSCRQVMLESETMFGKPIKIILDGEKTISILEGVESLLPLSFKPDFLK
jgi:cytidine deaminase